MVLVLEQIQIFNFFRPQYNSIYNYSTNCILYLTNRIKKSINCVHIGTTETKGNSKANNMMLSFGCNALPAIHVASQREALLRDSERKAQIKSLWKCCSQWAGLQGTGGHAGWSCSTAHSFLWDPPAPMGLLALIAGEPGMRTGCLSTAWKEDVRNPGPWLAATGIGKFSAGHSCDYNEVYLLFSYLLPSVPFICKIYFSSSLLNRKLYNSGECVYLLP